MFICQDCGKSFSEFNKLHGHYGQCKLHKEKMNALYEKHFSEKFLRWWFEKKHETANFLATLFNAKYEGYAHTKAGAIIDRAKTFGINTNGFSCYKNCKRLHKSFEGKNNILAKGNAGYETRQRHLAEEGIVNVFQRESVKQKIKETLMTKYGVHSTVELPWFKPNTGVESIPHKLVLEFLKENGFKPISDLKDYNKQMFSKFNDELNRVYSPRPDILLLDEKVIIEIYGNLWHADPRKYKDTDVIKKWGGTRTAKEIREFDTIRKRHLESFGFCVLELWVDEIKHGNYRNIIKNFLESKSLNFRC